MVILQSGLFYVLASLQFDLFCYLFIGPFTGSSVLSVLSVLSALPVLLVCHYNVFSAGVLSVLSVLSVSPAFSFNLKSCFACVDCYCCLHCPSSRLCVCLSRLPCPCMPICHPRNPLPLPFPSCHTCLLHIRVKRRRPSLSISPSASANVCRQNLIFRLFYTPEGKPKDITTNRK